MNFHSFVTTGFHIQAAFEATKDLISVLRYNLRRLQSGLTKPSSVDWDNVFLDIKSLRLLHEPVRLDSAQLKRGLAEVERLGVYSEATLFKSGLVMHEIRVLLDEAEDSVLADLPSYEPGFIGPRSPPTSASHPAAGNGDAGETRAGR